MSEMTYKVRKEDLDDIATAIMSKGGLAEKVLFEDFPSSILAITSGTAETDPGQTQGETQWYEVSKTDLDAIADAICTMRGMEQNRLGFDSFRSEIYSIITIDPEYSLWAQNGLAHTYRAQSGGNFYLSNGYWVASQAANITDSWNPVIPAAYNYLVVDCQSGGSNGYYNYCALRLSTVYGCANEFSLNGSTLKDVQICSFSMNAAAISAQSGVRISSTNQYALSRQKVIIDISNVTVDTYFGTGRCDNWTNLYSVVAMLAVTSTITIAYPEGYTCTATCGDVAKTAPSTGAAWALKIPFAFSDGVMSDQVWTFTADNGQGSVYTKQLTVTPFMEQTIYLGVPVRIEITTEPTKLVYEDGETIDFTGMVVTAYTEDNTVWTGYNEDGSIPHSALTFPVTVADFSEE